MANISSRFRLRINGVPFFLSQTKQKILNKLLLSVRFEEASLSAIRLKRSKRIKRRIITTIRPKKTDNHRMSNAWNEKKKKKKKMKKETLQKFPSKFYSKTSSIS